MRHGGEGAHFPQILTSCDIGSGVGGKKTARSRIFTRLNGLEVLLKEHERRMSAPHNHTHSDITFGSVFCCCLEILPNRSYKFGEVMTLLPGPFRAVCIGPKDEVVLLSQDHKVLHFRTPEELSKSGVLTSRTERRLLLRGDEPRAVNCMFC
jgi:hypothetical protein